MRALSLSQPWCWALFDPIADKGIENRSWAPPISLIGQTIAIHAAKSWDDKCIYQIAGDVVTPYVFIERLGIAHAPRRYALYPSSAIVGVATIDRVVTKADTLPELQQRWFIGAFGWVIPDRKKLPTPIPCKGKQGLWTVPAELESQVREQLGMVN